MPNLIHGRNAVLEAARAGRVLRVYRASGLGHDPRLEELATLTRVEIVSAERIDTMAPGVNQGVVAELKPRREWTLKELLGTNPDLLVALDSIQDPQNLGAILRSAEVAGANGAILPQHRSAPPRCPPPALGSLRRGGRGGGPRGGARRGGPRPPAAPLLFAPPCPPPPSLAPPRRCREVSVGRRGGATSRHGDQRQRHRHRDRGHPHHSRRARGTGARGRSVARAGPYEHRPGRAVEGGAREARRAGRGGGACSESGSGGPGRVPGI